MDINLDFMFNTNINLSKVILMIKEEKSQINPTTNFVNPKYKYHELVNVKNNRTFIEEYGYVEKGFAKCLKVFFGVEFKQEYKVYNTKDGKNFGSPFKCDFYAFVNNKHIVFEFNGPIHYQIPFKILTDKRKNLILRDPLKNNHSISFKVFKVPYYMQLTKDYAKYLFQDLALKKIGESFYSEEKFILAIKAIYNTSNENKIFAPGLHDTLETIASFCEDGIERFIKEVNEMAEKYPSIKHQIIKSLQLYIDDVTKYTNPTMKKLVIPLKNERFNKFYKFKLNEEYLNCIFIREKKYYDKA